MLSVWENETFYTSTDVIIIGAGITGLFTSIEIKTRFPQLRVRVVEGGTYPRGASVKNAGFACFGSLSEVLDDIDSEGEDLAFERIENRFKGILKLKQTVDPGSIDFASDDGFEIFSSNDDTLYQQCVSNLDSINDRLKSIIGFAPYSFVPNTYGFATSYPLLRIKGEGALHSGKLVQQLIAKASSLGVIFNFGLEVERFERTAGGWRVFGNQHCFDANRLIFATNGFTAALFPQLDIRPARGQLLLTEPITGFSLKGTFHAQKGYYYFRSLGNRILLGGARNISPNTENTNCQDVTDEVQSALDEFLHTMIIPTKTVDIDKRWAGTMAFGSNNEKTPIVEELESDLIVAARLGGMGVAMAPLIAEKIVNQYF